MPLDDADKKAIAEMIAGALKPEALTAALQPLVASAVTAATKPITERLDKGEQAAKAAEAEAAKKAAEAEAAKKAAAEEEAKKASGGKPAEPDPAIATQIRQLQEQLKAERDARTAAETRTKQETLDRTLRDALAGAGIPADRLRHALAVIHADGVIAEHNGAPHWKGKVGGVDGLHALSDGRRRLRRGGQHLDHRAVLVHEVGEGPSGVGPDAHAPTLGGGRGPPGAPSPVGDPSHPARRRRSGGGRGRCDTRQHCM